MYTRDRQGESVRAFPLSNWTELDIWLYIYREGIPVVPLYFAAERPVVERDGALILVDDARLPLHDGEVPQLKKVRFRTLGCYPLTGAIESEAGTLEEIIAEMLVATTSERQGRVIDQIDRIDGEKKLRYSDVFCSGGPPYPLRFGVGTKRSRQGRSYKGDACLHRRLLQAAETKPLLRFIPAAAWTTASPRCRAVSVSTASVCSTTIGGADRGRSALSPVRRVDYALLRTIAPTRTGSPSRA